MMNTKLSGALIVLLGVGLVWLFVGGVDEWGERKPPSDARNVDTEELSNKITMLERRTRNLQLRHAAIVGAASKRDREGSPVPMPEIATLNDRADADEVQESAPTQPDLSPMERDQLFLDTARSTFDEVLGREPQNRGWTAESRTSLDELLAAPEFAGSRTHDVECGVSVCKLVIEHDDGAAWESFDRNALTRAPFQGNFFFNHDVETRETVVYLAAPGQTLPPVDLL